MSTVLVGRRYVRVEVLRQEWKSPPCDLHLLVWREVFTVPTTMLDPLLKGAPKIIAPECSYQSEEKCAPLEECSDEEKAIARILPVVREGPSQVAYQVGFLGLEKA